MDRFPKVIAHRGMPFVERENTLPSFQKAIETGAQMIEFDVRRTGDGIIVVHHDPHVQCEEAKYYISALPYDKLNSLVDYHIPTLEEFLLLCTGRIELDIELKEAGYEKDVLDVVLKYYAPESFILTSFHDAAIKIVNQLHPGLRTGLLFVMKEDWDTLLGRVKACGAMSLAPHFWLVTQQFMENAKRHNLPVWVWTVDDRETMEKLADLGVAGIITDYCDLALEVRSEHVSGSQSL
ncbi:MAG: glycerophosphodiester phosphodiesterase [Ignavibacteriales bacterium]